MVPALCDSCFSEGSGRTELEKTKPEELQPWITCHLTDILLSHIKELNAGRNPIDYAELFKGVEGFELPADPESFLTGATNWAPLSVNRELELYGEKISGRKDFAYQAARAYFKPGKKDLPSLVEIIFQVLNDVRSTLIFCTLMDPSSLSGKTRPTFGYSTAVRQISCVAHRFFSTLMGRSSEEFPVSNPSLRFSCFFRQ